MNPIYDFHVHSNISKDSDESLIAMAMAARELDMPGLCFTEHLDPFFPDDFEPFYIDWNKYKTDIYNARMMFPELDIYMGMEAGLYHKSYEEINKQIEENNLDFVIGSMHCTDEMTIGEHDYYTRYEKRKIQEDYINAYIKNIQNFDNFDVVAHIGFLSKFAPGPDWEILYKDFKEQIDELLKLIISKGKGIEVNASGLKNSAYTLPEIDIIKRFRELKGEIITVGSDAHSKIYVGYEFDYIKVMLHKMGIQYLTKFENRKPVFYQF